MPGAVSIVDVDHRHPRRAGVEHGQQRRQAVEGRPVAHRGGHGDDGRGDEPGDHRGQRAVHARDDDDRRRPLEQLAAGEDPLQPGDPHVDEQLHAAAQVTGGEPGLPGDRDVGGAGAGDDDEPAPRSGGLARPGQQTGPLVPAGPGQHRRHGLGARCVHAGEQGRPPVGAPAQRRRYGDQLLHRLALPVDGLGDAAADRAPGVELGDAGQPVDGPAVGRGLSHDAPRPRAAG